jgi:hypothetical protein
MNAPAKKIFAPAILIFCMSLSTACAQALPVADDVSSQAKEAKLTFEKFRRETIQPRLAHEYKGYFFDEKHRTELSELSRQAGSDLKKIYDAQDKLRKRIENYQGDNWDRLYGQTGLWRKVCADAQRTLLFKAQVDYFAAIASKQQDRVRILQDIVRLCKTNEDKWDPDGNLLMAKALVLAGQNQAANKTLEPVHHSKHLSDAVYFKVEILQLRLSGTNSPELLKMLFSRIEKSRCADDFEINLELAFLALRLQLPDLLKKVIEKWPEAADFVGSVILSEMEHRRTLGRMTKQTLLQKSLFEVTLAVKAAIVRGAAKYKELLNKLCYGLDKFRCSLLYYALARANLEDDPARAVEYYSEAATLKKPVGDGLDIKKTELAKKAATLAYKLYYEDPKHCELAGRAAGYYCDIADSDADEQIRYRYAALQNECGDDAKATDLLQKIAQSTGKFSKQAKLDLIIHELKDSQDNLELRHNLTKRLKALITSINAADKQDDLVKADAIELYCRLILENDDHPSARKVLTLLEETRGLDIQCSGILKAAALKKLGRFWSAVNELLTAAKFDNCEYGAEGLDILRTILDNRIDEHKYYMADFAFYIDACDKLAEYCLACAQPQWQVQARLIRAEIAILCPRKSLVGDDNNESIDKAEQILTKLSVQGLDNDIDWLRCKARLSKAKGRFADAARDWGRICNALRTTATPKSQTWQWWRAKFYQIQSWANLPGTTEADVDHAVEVLQNSYSNIPDFWAAKLEKLKNRTNQ